ncbi:MAG: hypothetical protein DRO00_04215 [Thermoproteota archaeon]|nr:MAG: hypothetical protein DRO00_04215 [Candidatus Korarchaeota archaeon]
MVGCSIRDLLKYSRVDLLPGRIILNDFALSESSFSARYLSTVVVFLRKTRFQKFFSEKTKGGVRNGKGD